jgi:hypothetical protein
LAAVILLASTVAAPSIVARAAGEPATTIQAPALGTPARGTGS